MSNITGDRMGPNSVKQLWKEIAAIFQRKESGKGLSTNDYTTAEKNKLAGIMWKCRFSVYRLMAPI